MSLPALKKIIQENRSLIFDRQLQRLNRLPKSPYREFARSIEGHRRIDIWLDNITQAVDGNPQVFYTDTEKVGYLRAHQGFNLDFIVQFYRIFKQIIWELARKKVDEGSEELEKMMNSLHELSDILFQGLSHVTASYLKTREEIINEKVKQLQQLNEKMQTLTTNTITVQENERKRLAGDIHDTITQSLTGIGYKIQYCQELFQTEPSQIDEQLNMLLDTVHHAINQSREMISSLRPDMIDTLGLVPALKKHLQRFELETGIRVNCELAENIRLDSEINICLFRTVQESLMNIFKHAEIKEAELALLEKRGAVILTINDRGRGFSDSLLSLEGVHGSGMGLIIMRERIEALAGTLMIRTKPGRGCRLEARIPLGRKIA
ncbi:sensor histidine kinase [bacterium]|nr:sensor histidine kinase [bacterium]